MHDPIDTLTIYLPPEVIDYPGKWLVAEGTSGPEGVFLFFNRVEIGRFHEKRNLPGVLLVKDQTVSSRHCVVTQDPDGRCFVRDTSRNGTRVDGRRLTPNLQTELELGQVLSIGRSLNLRLDGQPPTELTDRDDESVTQGIPETTLVTVLVGDIRNYTNIIRMADSTEIQDSVNRVFSHLEAEVQECGGTIKEFQGDAIFAFWEEDSTPDHAIEACRAALHLDEVTKGLARDGDVWGVEGFPLEMDWALATGPVSMRGHGGEHAVGLTMVGEVVVLAFRIEKLAEEGFGHIIACPRTMEVASSAFEFEPLGSRRLKGLDREFELFSLTGEAGPDAGLVEPSHVDDPPGE